MWGEGGGTVGGVVARRPDVIGAGGNPGGGRLLASIGWFAPVRRDAWLQRPDLLNGRSTRTINLSTIGHHLLRPSSHGFGPVS